MVPTRRLKPFVPLVGAVLASLVLAGCLSRTVGTMPTQWWFQNRTELPVTITWVRDDGEQRQVAIVEAWGTRSIDIDKFGVASEICDEGELVVTDAFGDPVTRRPMTCDPWVIEVDGSAAPS